MHTMFGFSNTTWKTTKWCWFQQPFPALSAMNYRYWKKHLKDYRRKCSNFCAKTFQVIGIFSSLLKTASRKNKEDKSSVKSRAIKSSKLQNKNISYKLFPKFQNLPPWAKIPSQDLIKIKSSPFIKLLTWIRFEHTRIIYDPLQTLKRFFFLLVYRPDGLRRREEKMSARVPSRAIRLRAMTFSFTFNVRCCIREISRQTRCGVELYLLLFFLLVWLWHTVVWTLWFLVAADGYYRQLGCIYTELLRKKAMQPAL